MRPRWLFCAFARGQFRALILPYIAQRLFRVCVMGERTQAIPGKLRIFLIGHRNIDKPGQRVEQNINMMRNYCQDSNIATGL